MLTYFAPNGKTNIPNGQEGKKWCAACYAMLLWLAAGGGICAQGKRQKTVVLCGNQIRIYVF